MIYQSFFISVTFSVLLFSVSAQAQAPTPAPGSEPGVSALREKAKDLLLSVAGQVNSLRSAENRARIGSNVAELLWDHDEKRARSLFAAVGEDIKVGFSDADTDEAAHKHTVMVFWQLRSDTLGRISGHDPELAFEFLLATRPPPDMKLPYELVNREQALELRLAGQIAAKNPQLALKLARESLAKGFSLDLLTLLSELTKKNKEIALGLYKEIVEKLRGANLAQNYEAFALALSLARSFHPREFDEQVHRELIGILSASALANGCGDATDEFPRICYEIGWVFSQIEKYFAPSAARLKRWAGTDQSFEEPFELSKETRDVFEHGTVEEILALTPKNPGLEHQIYWSAMKKAQSSGDVAMAREIASSYPDEVLRADMLSEIEQDQKWKSLDADKLAAIQQQLSKLRNNEERIHFLFNVASQLGANDRKAALGLLNQANQLIDSSKPGKTQIQGQIVLAMLYCSLKSERGFTIMESLIPRLNELVAFASGLDQFENNYLRDGEWNMTGEGAVGGLLTALAQNAGYFAGSDFDRSVTLAHHFERPELRLMAELKIAQSILTKEPKQLLMFPAPLIHHD